MNPVRWIIALAFVCGALGASAQQEAIAVSDTTGFEGREATFYYTEGIKRALIYGDTARAVNLFDRAIAIDSTHAPSWFEAANTLIMYNPKRALPYSERACALDSTNLWYKAQLGRLMIINGEYSKALTLYENLTREAPHNPENYRMLAALYENNGQPFSAIAVLDSAQYKLGRYEQLADFKRQLLVGVRLYDRAIAESRAMVADNPYDYSNYLVLAELYATTGKDSLAQESYNQALTLNGQGADVLMSMNEYYKKRNDTDNYFSTARQLFLSDELAEENKIRFFKEVTSNRDFYRDHLFRINDLAATLATKYPESYEVLDLYASHIAMTGNIEEALRLYKSRIGHRKPDIRLFNNVLEIESYLQRPDSVEKYSALALRSFPDNADLYLRKGSMQAYMKDTKAAEKSYMQALKYAGTDSLRGVIYGILGDMEHQRGNAKKSYAWYDKSLKYYSDNSMALNNYAYYLSLEDRHLEKALEMSARSNELSPNNATYLDTWAWVLYKLERYAEAKKTMQKAISLDRSESMELAVHYGDILYKLGENFMASVYWKKAQERGYDQAEITSRLKLIGE